MDIERIKTIWKANAIKWIDSYSDSEITDIVLKSACKAMDSSYPGILFWTIFMVSNLLLVALMTYYSPPHLTLYGYVLMGTITLFLSGTAFLSEWGRRKSRQYSYDRPLKEWIELRIHDFDRGLYRNKRNWFWKNGLGLLVLTLFCLIYILTVGFSLKIVLIQWVAGLTVLLISSTIGNRIFAKRMQKTRKQLQELYSQLQEPEE